MKTNNLFLDIHYKINTFYKNKKYIKLYCLIFTKIYANLCSHFYIKNSKLS